MIQSYFKHLFATSVNNSDFKILPFVHKMAKIYLFCGRGFHTPVEWKIGYKVINKQIIIQILIVNTAFYIHGNMRFKDISILNLFEQIQENALSGSAFSAQLGHGFHTRPLWEHSCWLSDWFPQSEVLQNPVGPVCLWHCNWIDISHVRYSSS